MPAQYDNFAKRCGNFVAASSGCHIWIIGNEMNIAWERPGNNNGKGGEVITPQRYAACYKKCRAEIRRRAGHGSDQVVVGAVGPYNIQTTYPGNPTGDFKKYLADILALIDQVDGIALHAYTHGQDPTLVFSEAKMTDSRVKHLHSEFRIYRDFMAAIPERFRDRPVYITEADQYIDWRNSNSGWVRNAYLGDQPLEPGCGQPADPGLDPVPLDHRQSQRPQGGGLGDPEQAGSAERFPRRNEQQLPGRPATPDCRCTRSPGWKRPCRGGSIQGRKPSSASPSATTGGAPGPTAAAKRCSWATAGSTRAARPQPGSSLRCPRRCPPAAASHCPQMTVRPPDKPGFYTLELDLVEGTSKWFASRGSPTKRVGGVQVGPRYLAAVLNISAPTVGDGR